MAKASKVQMYYVVFWYTWCVSFQIATRDIGTLLKVRVSLDEPTGDVEWDLKKVLKVEIDEQGPKRSRR